MIYTLLSNISIALCFLPILLIWLRKLQFEKAYIFTAIYWFVNGLMNLPGWIGQAGNAKLLHHITLIYNLLDAPMVLLVFLFSVPQNRRRSLRLTLIVFLVFELVTVLWKGYNLSSSIVIIGAGTFLAITFSIMGVMEYLQKMEHSSFENAMVFVYGSFLFAYGIFIVIYLFSYLKIVPSTSNDNFLIYYISLLLSTSLSSFGLWRFPEKSAAQIQSKAPENPKATAIGRRA